MRTLVQNFLKHDCYTQASVLTFYTIQAIVPLLAFLLAIFKGLGLEEYLEEAIKGVFNEHQEVMNYALQMAHSLLAHVNDGVVMGAGIIVLIWTNLNLLGYIESALNKVFNIAAPRAFSRKLTDYLSIIILCPLFFIASNSLTIYAKMKIAAWSSHFLLEVISWPLLFALRFTPFALNVLLFLFLYSFIPNAQIKLRSTFIASFFAGALFQLWQLIYINFQSTLFNYNAIYGAFAALPLFLIWLQFNWLIALAGAEIAAYKFE